MWASDQGCVSDTPASSRSPINDKLGLTSDVSRPNVPQDCQPGVRWERFVGSTRRHPADSRAAGVEVRLFSRVTIAFV
jgi:hypothetical protein